jgi:cytochrome c peroxidase
MQRLKLFLVISACAAAAAALFTPSGAHRAKGQVVGGQLAAPTQLTASDAMYATKVGLHWQPIAYATTYRIYRNTTNSPESATDVGTTAANYFFDPSAVAGTQYFYWVRAENSQSVSELSASDAGLRAVGNNNPGAPFPPLQPPPAPLANPVTAAKAYLGKTLFWDEQLSSTKTVSCGTCHSPAAGGADPRTSATTRHPGFDNTFNTADDVFGSPGVPNGNAAGDYSPVQFFGMGLQVTGRQSPSYLNAGYTTDGLFWDGRATNQFRDPITNAILLNSFGGLESQSVGPPLNTAEMGHIGRDWPAVVSRITSAKPLVLASNIPAGLANWIGGRTYPELFAEAFGTPDITPARIAMAIGTHERTLFSDQTPLDRWSAGLEQLTPQEEQGRNIFIQQQCTFCHGGALLTNSSYQNVGLRPTNEDRGRGAITGIADDNGRFKTPTLRNLELRPQYFHNGRMGTVEEVVAFYNRGGDFNAPNVDPRIQPLGLNAGQQAALAAFLKRPLTDPRVANQLPPFDRPTLYTETNRVPTISGIGRPGTGAVVPNAIAIEPPVVGNERFTIALSDVPAGAAAYLVIDAADPGVGSAIPSGGSFAYVARTTLGTGNAGYASAVLSIPNNAALVGRTFLARWYVTDPGAANGFSVSRLISFTVFGTASAVANDPQFDFDGDAKTDLSIFRPAVGEWWINRSSNATNAAFQFGTSADRIAPADFTGDGKTDVAFFRPSTGSWFVLRSEDSSFFSFPFGANGDVPVPADFDADGKADPAVFRPSSATWFINKSTGGTDILVFGTSADQPVVADYDGDAKADIAIYRPLASGGEWWLRRSSTGVVFATVFGTSTDRTVQGDYTGDGKADIAFWRPSNGNWFILRSEDLSFFAFPFGANGDIPVPGDYDGDGKNDAAVFRPSSATWFANKSSGGTLIQTFGANGDTPLPSAYVR